MALWDSVIKIITSVSVRQAAQDNLTAQTTLEDLERAWEALPQDTRDMPAVSAVYDMRLDALGGVRTDKVDPLVHWIDDALKAWVDSLGALENVTPETARQRLAEITSMALKVTATATLVDLGLGMLPNSAGYVSSNTTRSILTALGVSAVVAAVAHDPVKIGVLRPYSDALEMTFRNRRPDDNALFQAYRTRELSPTPVEDLTKLDDGLMDRIEKENDAVYNREIAKWGYSVEFARSLSLSATRTPSFGNLMALARLGLLDRGMAIYSLWGYGYDRVTMRPMLEALEGINQVSNFEGFRSMIEPAYVEGHIEERDLVAYYDRIRVPKAVQEWIMPRMRARREKSLKAAATGLQVKERDLNLSQVQAAYVAGLVERSTALNMVLDLGYTQEEAGVLMALADARIKIPKVPTFKRLPLTDYEKAYKNGLISRADVLERMAGEYDDRDIALEGALLDIGKA